MEIRRLSLEDWGTVLPQTGFEVFHTAAALSVLDDHTSGELVLLGGFKGETPVAAMPVFRRSSPVGQILFSPPPQMGIPRLGPLVMPNSPKRSKREKVTRRFVEGVVEELDATGPLSFVRLRCGVAFRDPRPFDWHGFDVEPAFTYLLDVDAPDVETLLKPFSSSLRREMRLSGESDLTVTRGGLDGAGRIVEQVCDRYDEQQRAASIEWPFVRDLVEAVGDRARAYVARSPDGQYLGGILALVSNDTVYYWQGGVGRSYEETLPDGTTRSISVNALLHRTILEDIITDPALDDVDRYDLVGANTARLCTYKSKFGGALTPYYVVESSGASTAIAKSGYQWFTRHR